MGVRTNKNICLYCFGDLDANRVCTKCHRPADDSPVPPNHLPQRTVLGDEHKYLFGKAIGQGGFGITYLGWDLTYGKKVAIKEYFPSNFVTRLPGANQVVISSKQYADASNRGLARFIDEARTLTQIKNMKGIVSVKDFFTANGTAYIVMEFLDGMSFKKYIQRKGGSITVESALAIISPVIESLAQVHKQGLIHMDISPDNILITKTNDVKLIDFGSAKRAYIDTKGAQAIVLKQGFAPPEQYTSTGNQGPWTDIYALGVTLYYAITGKIPPESTDRRLNDALAPPSKLGVKIQPVVEFALMKAMAVEINERYQDLSDLIKTLYPQNMPRAMPKSFPITNDDTSDPSVMKNVHTTAFIDVSKDIAAGSNIVETPVNFTPDALEALEELNLAAQFRNKLLNAESPTISVTTVDDGNNVPHTEVIPTPLSTPKTNDIKK